MDKEMVYGPNESFDLAGQYLDEGNLEKAAEIYEKIANAGDTPSGLFVKWGICLDGMGRGRQSRDIFLKEILRHNGDYATSNPEIVAGAFSRVIMKDFLIGEKVMREDLELYKAFLLSIEINDSMRRWLASNMVNMSEKLNYRWFRPVFLDFIHFVDEKGFFSDTIYERTLHTGYRAYESWGYREDHRIGAFMESLLCVSDAERPKGRITDERRINDAGTLDAYEKLMTYEWYLCEGYDSYRVELKYACEKYPYTTEPLTKLIKRLEKGYGDKIKAELEKELRRILPNEYKDGITKALTENAPRAFAITKAPVKLADGHSTYRSAKKIMPNDPCSCGSGKKYKWCCGKR